MRPSVEPLELQPGVHALPEGGLWLPGDGLVAVSDLHLGYEAHYREGGAFVPDHAVDAVIERVDALLTRYRPHTFLVNGDVKHAFTQNLVHERRALTRLEAHVTDAGANLVPVRGNHDGKLEAMLDAEVVDAHRAGGCVFAHGHKRLERAPDETLVVGHEHPAVTLRDAVGIGLKLPAILHDPQARVVVLPALSPWAGGVDPTGRAGFRGVLLEGLRPLDFSAYAVDEDVLYPLGNLGALKRAQRRGERRGSGRSGRK